MFFAAANQSSLHGGLAVVSSGSSHGLHGILETLLALVLSGIVSFERSFDLVDIYNMSANYH